MAFVRVFFKVLLKDSTFTDWTFKEAGDGNWNVKSNQILIKLPS